MYDAKNHEHDQKPIKAVMLYGFKVLLDTEYRNKYYDYIQRNVIELNDEFFQYGTEPKKTYHFYESIRGN